ncbi:hypothetical protein IW16_22865 [Chryseobacterium vrystaatense]|uniref:Uncharacterized protein n=2 Tax=Chryseobacterium vrystaatense TaxID=307480 RepID=A0ABR4UHW2_9FLAO|nr:hypothetical protein IW16_22865 [Chryseobacterium vrystaatense]
MLSLKKTKTHKKRQISVQMKNRLFTIAALFTYLGISAQVGINTNQGQATLDVVGFPSNTKKLDGIIAPRLTGDQLRAKTYTSAQSGALVYVTAADSSPAGQTVHVNASGYYYFDGMVWLRNSTGVNGGTVTNFSAGALNPLFTTSVLNPSTAPALSFNLSNAPANTIFGNNGSSAAAPGYFSTGSLLVNGDVVGALATTTVAKINGSPLGNTGSATNGQVLTFNGTSWVPSTPIPQSGDWRVSGNSDITAANVSASVGSAASTVTNLKYLGTQNANDLVLVANGTIRAVINSTDGSLTGGGTDGDSYLSWGSKNTLTKSATYNNGIVLGYNNTLNSSGQPSHATTAVAIGKGNTINQNGTVIGYGNTTLGGYVLGINNTTQGGVTIGTKNNSGGNFNIIGHGFNSGSYPVNSFVGPTGSSPGSNIYSNKYHIFNAQDTSTGTPLTAFVGINTLLTAAQEADLKVSKAVQVIGTVDTAMVCNGTNEGSIRYVVTATSGNFQGCRKTASGTWSWAQLNN